MALTYDDVMHLMSYAKRPASDIEVLGYEKSREGLRQYLKERPDIEPLLLSAILGDLRTSDTFPRAFASSVPQAYTAYIEKAGLLYAVVEIDKPTVWTKSYFSTPEEAATYLIAVRVERSWLTPLRPSVQPVRIESAP